MCYNVVMTNITLVVIMLQNINWTAFIALIIYPLFLITLGIHYGIQYDIRWSQIILAIAGYYGSNIAVGVGLHRLWAHNAFKAHKVAEFILVMMSAGTLQGPVLSWASNHYNHHTFTDTEQDPHSPLKYNKGIVGFMWSHIGWMLVGKGSNLPISRITMVKLGRNNLLKWQLKYYWHLAIFMNTIAPAIVGYLVGGTLFSAYTGFVFIGLGRALQQQATFCVNSACHYLGTKTYANSTAGDIWWLAIFLLGENWHNYHHAFPSDYRNGVKWYQFDVHKWIIYLMSKVGLAWNLDCTPDFRIQAKVAETAKKIAEGRQQEVSLLQEKIEQLTAHLYIKINELEHSSVNIKNQLGKSFLEAQERLKNIADQLHTAMQLKDKSAEKLVKLASEKISSTESMISDLYNKLEKLSSKKALL